MRYKRILIVGLLLVTFLNGYAQRPFDTVTQSYKNSKLGELYSELMRNVSAIKIIEENPREIVKTPGNMEGEATFVYEVKDNGELVNIYITEVWGFKKDNGKISKEMCYEFVDAENVGYDYDKIYKALRHTPAHKVLNHLFDYIRNNKRFEVIRPRERNLKYERVYFSSY